MGMPEGLPVAVIGAGPVGLAAAAHLISRGLPVKVYEAGETAGANVRDWGHVRLFSPWGYNIDQAAKALLMHHGWREPCADTFPTGVELVNHYLAPLATTPEMAAVIETGARGASERTLKTRLGAGGG
jgi:phytoene dehydrogenase-like protein